MKPLHIKIQDEANLKKVPMHVIEKDYEFLYLENDGRASSTGIKN